MQVELTKDQYVAVKDTLSDFIAEKDGKQMFEGESVAEVATLKTTLKKERSRADAAEKKVKDFGDLDVDAAKEALDAVASGKLKTDDDVQKAIKAAKKEGAEAEAAKLKPTIDSLTSEVSRHKLTEPVRRAALESGVKGDRIDDVLTLTGSRFKLDDDKVKVIGADGEISSMSLADFFSKEYKTARPEFYTANGGGGSGSKGSESNGAAGKKSMTRDAFFKTLSPAEQTEFSKQGGTLTD